MTRNASAQAVFDRDLALSRVGGDEELLRELAMLFIEEYPRLMADLREAQAQGNMVRVERAAHSLKGSAGNFGAKEITATAAAIENAGRNNDPGSVNRKLETLEAALASLHKELTEL